MGCAICRGSEYNGPELFPGPRLAIQRAGQKQGSVRMQSMKCFLISVTVCLGSLTLADKGGAPKDQPSSFKITTKKKDDTAQVRADKDKTVFVVKSPSGISQAVIERQEETWPKLVVLRLHLKGLENFRASNGKVRLDAAAGIQDGKEKVRIWKDGKENAPLDKKSPFWMEIRILGSDGKPAKKLPLKKGYFEIILPRAVFEGSPKSITLNWIDFYRN
jgi:hypothetical protein